MKKSITLLLLAVLPFLVIAQNNQLKGVITSEDGVLAFANVLLKNAQDSSLIKAEISNENGAFQLSQIPNGSYFLESSYIGYDIYTSPIFQLNGDIISLDPIRLKTANTTLEAITITGIKPIVEVLADKTVFNVQNTISASGNDGFELLRKAPGVIIDNNNNIILEGKTGVQIFINNKPSPFVGEDLTNFLSALQSSDIEAIEIITQPSSKYDAAGNAGIINIKLKKDKRLGTNGTLNIGVTQGRNTRYNSSLSFNNRSKGANLFGTLSRNSGQNWSFINLYRTQSNVQYESETETLTDNTANNLKLGLDLFPGEFHTLGFLVNGSFFDRQQNGQTNTPITPLATGQLTQLLVANSESINNNSNLAGNINYRFADTIGHELLFDIDYGQYQRDANSFQPNQYFDGSGNLIFERNFRMNTPIDIKIFTTQIDYSQNWLGGKLGLGLKYSRVNTDNTFEFFDQEDGNFNLNQNRSNQFKYTENVNAAYVNFNKKWSKWNIQLGLRLEQTISEGDLTSAVESEEDNVQRNYLDWFPSGGITFTPSWKSSLALTYSRRIQRPNYQSLNPFENQIDELTFSKGNPFLQPQYTNNLKLSHTYKYRLTTAVSYSYISDFFAQITDTLGTTRNFLITRNIANQQVWNLSISYPFDMAKWWNVYASVNAFHSAYEGADEKFVSVNQNTLSFYAQNTFSLPSGFKLEISGWYSSPSVWGGTYITRSLGSLNLAIQKKLVDDRLTARISVNDIFFTSPWEGDMQFGDLSINGTGGWESRNVRMNLSYNFGRNEIKKNRKRKTGLETEENRVSN